MHTSPSLRAALCAALLLTAAGCKHIPTEKEQQEAQIHYDLGVQAQNAGDVQGAYKEFERAIQLDPNFPEPYFASALLMHLSFKRPEEAVARYKRALTLRPDYSEAKVNLAAVYLDEGRYDEAISLYEEVLNDLLYKTPYIAQNSLGWALYKRGKPEDQGRAIEMLKSAVTTNPKFCQGYRNLGLIYFKAGQTGDACTQFAHYKDKCPEVADAYYQEGVCAAKQGDNELARQDFAACQAKSQNETMKDDCKRLLSQLQ